MLSKKVCFIIIYSVMFESGWEVMKHFEETIISAHGMLHLLYIHFILKLIIINENLDCYQSEAKGR